MISSEHTSEWRRFLRVGKTHSKINEQPRKKATSVKSNLISRYGEVGKVIGDGAGGKVFTMKRRGDGKVVAIKRFTRSELREDHARRAVAEFYIGSRFNHVNVIQNLELLEDSSQWYQVMEYAPHNLFDRVTSGDMSPEEIHCCFAQISNGLAYVHLSGFAHRDLKLENVVYTEQGVMKLIDFGVAAECGSEDEYLSVSTEATGCRPYMGPELFSEKFYNPKAADIWSLGIVYCCMVRGSFPWKEACESDRRYANFSTPKDSRGILGQYPGGKTIEITVLEISDAVDGASLDSIELTATTEERDGVPDLLKELPEGSRDLIRCMLRTVPQHRWTMKQVNSSPFVCQTLVCSRRNDQVSPTPMSHRHVC